jgi:3-mercaptopyruvate sulfurtransferase SseA
MGAVLGVLLMTTTWTMTPAELIARPAGTVTVLDARGVLDYWRGHIPGAVRIRWWAYRDGWFRTGRLPGDLERLAREMAALGVDARRPVVVYGKAREGNLGSPDDPHSRSDPVGGRAGLPHTAASGSRIR